jgi:hypothetical protein
MAYPYDRARLADLIMRQSMGDFGQNTPGGQSYGFEGIGGGGLVPGGLGGVIGDLGGQPPGFGDFAGFGGSAIGGATPAGFADTGPATGGADPFGGGAVGGGGRGGGFNPGEPGFNFGINPNSVPSLSASPVQPVSRGDLPPPFMGQPVPFTGIPAFQYEGAPLIGESFDPDWTGETLGSGGGAPSGSGGRGGGMLDPENPANDFSSPAGIPGFDQSGKGDVISGARGGGRGDAQVIIEDVIPVDTRGDKESSLPPGATLTSGKSDFLDAAAKGGTVVDYGDPYVEDPYGEQYSEDPYGEDPYGDDPYGDEPGDAPGDEPGDEPGDDPGDDGPGDDDDAGDGDDDGDDDD